jgi:segregation and condensation protein B
MIDSERTRHEALRLLEALLFASAEPMTERQIAERLPHGSKVGKLLSMLAAEYASRGVNLVRAGDTWAFQTAADLAPLLARERHVEKKLSRAAIETLAIIAYNQPVTRGDIEELRGVQLGKGTLDALFEQGWIEPKGRRETPGRPTTWATTDAFLRHFGLAALADLPGIDEMKAAGLLDLRPAIQVLHPGQDEAAESPALAAEPLDPDAR